MYNFFRGGIFVIGRDASKEGFENRGVVWVISNSKYNSWNIFITVAKGGFNESVFIKMEVFHMRCLCRILKIKWCDVMENKITHILVNKYFNNIRTIESQIMKRRLIFRGKNIRLPSFKIPSRLISVFYSILLKDL